MLCGALGLLAVSLTAWFSRSTLTAPHGIEVVSPDPSLFAALPPHAPIAILSTAVEDTMMPVERFGLTWAQRTNNLWPLVAVLRSQSPSLPHDARTAGKHLTPAQNAALAADLHRWMRQDLIRWHPVLVLVARCQDPTVHCQELEDRHDDLLAWFARDPAFRALWQSYRLTATRGDYDAYTLQPPRAINAVPSRP